MVSSVPPRDETSIADDKVAATDAQIVLQRLLSSPDFSASARRKALLAYLVQQTFEGGAGKLKEFSIGLAAFGRDETFDPRADPVVRLEVHRLRRDLDEFYRGTGRDDPIRIMVPKGGYSVTFEPQRNAAEPLSPPTVGSAVAALISRPWLVVGSAVIALALLVTFQLELISRNPIAAARLGPGGSGVEARRGPIIALFAIRNTSPEPQDVYFTDGLSEQLVSDLLRFENLRVISPEGVKPYDDAINTVKNLRTKLGVDYVLRGNARRIDNKLRLALELADTKTDQVVWAETFMRKLAPDDLVEVQKDISAKLAATIGSHYGAVVGPALPLAETRLPAQFSSYDCVLQYYALVKATLREPPPAGAILPGRNGQKRTRLCDSMGGFGECICAGVSLRFQSTLGAVRSAGTEFRRGATGRIA